jgi:sensor domain CHASE-containing protein
MPPLNSPDVRINEVVTDIAVTEGVGPLSAQEVKKIVALVMEQVRTEQDRHAQRAKDTTIRDRAYQPRIGD